MLEPGSSTVASREFGSKYLKMERLYASRLRGEFTAASLKRGKRVAGLIAVGAVSAR